MKMSKEEKAIFIENMFETLKKDALVKVDYMPEEWDGWELRQYMADKTNDIVWPSSADKGRKRKYTNTIRTTGNLY
jgi:hypothetical protein